MSERIHILAQQIFGKNSLEDCDLQEVKDLANRYPYFAPAQFLLLSKLQEKNAPEYSAQLQKSVLYYHNPLEFEYFISSNRFYTEVDFEEVPDAVDKNPSNLLNQAEEEKVLESPASVETETMETIRVEAENEEQMAASIERVVTQEERQVTQPSKDDLVFEPYHTVDYFASQGIKLSQEEIPKDKFGKQLKSFTEWLKTMKRLPVSELSKNIDSNSETKVQHLAEDSVHESDVLTEAMAEVWIKQGNKEKALKIYDQLSLLNPSKMAYFADLIEKLKRL